jgi:hypothetical protein
MPLDNNQKEQLKTAIIGYMFPSVYYDFGSGLPANAQNMSVVEEYINRLLKSQNVIDVKHGLANVLYWGYAQVGYRNLRVNNFIKNSNEKQIHNFHNLLLNNATPTLIAIKNLKLPEFSGMSFVSKILMFLDPENYCVLDKKISKLRNPECMKSLSHLTFGPKDTQIRISQQNQGVYNNFREECRLISGHYFQNNYRVADIERGFFTLIQSNELAAQQIYNNA